MNPYTSGDVDLQVTQNLLYGFGSAVNSRNIRVQKNNIKVTDLQFKQQVIATVSSVLNLYWDLTSFDEDVRAAQRGLDSAQQLLDNNQKQVDAGTLAPIEVTRAEAAGLRQPAGPAGRRRPTCCSRKPCLKTRSAATAWPAPIWPTSISFRSIPFTIPATDNIGPSDQLFEEALTNRPEIAQSKLNIDSNKLNLAGIKNALKPTLQVFAELTNNGLTGAITPAGETAAGVGYLGGGYGNLLGQIFRRNFPNYSAGISLNIPLRNRAAQSDYVTSQLELRQNELGLQQNVNQVRVDVQNAVIGLHQARARYESAQKARVLQQQTQDADEKRYALGASTSYQLVLDQQTVAAAQNTEEQALANYSHARIAFDQAMGTTLQANHVSVEEALSGKVSRQSVLPANLPQESRP